MICAVILQLEAYMTQFPTPYYPLAILPINSNQHIYLLMED
jgi:hypothetical protein